MLKELLDEHLTYIDKYIVEGSIIAYRGFPNSFIMEIASRHQFVRNTDKIDNNGKIKLELIEETKQELIKDILYKECITKVLLYEELILIDREINIGTLLDREIIVFDNSILRYFPNQSNQLSSNLEKLIEEDRDIEEDEVIDIFYSNSSNFKETELIQYKTIKDDLKIKVIDFYSTIILDTKIEAVKVKPGSEIDLSNKNIFLSFDSEELQEILYGLYLGNKTRTNELSFSYNFNQSKIDIRIIGTIFGKIGIKCKFYETINGVTDKYRNDLNIILKNNWGYDTFREITFYSNPDSGNEKHKISQGVLIEDIIKQVESSKIGNRYSDILITAPTGAGKSVIFQVPAIYIANKYNYVTIVVSPLIALMYDQVSSLKEKGVYIAEYINSEKSPNEREEIIEKVKSGNISILYLSPELLLSYDISHFIGDRELGLLVIDEAHLVTTWGRDFRVDYWYLGSYIRKIRKYKSNLVTLALTATAVYGGEDDMIFETIDSLSMKRPTNLYIGNVVRDDIEFNFKEFEYEGSYDIERTEKTKSVIKRYASLGIKTLVYFPFESHIRDMYGLLVQEGLKDKIGTYYGNLDKTLKKQNLDKFKSGELKVMLATKAFGMGIDIDDIRVVYHHAPSGSISDYVQEVGRAARKVGLVGSAEIDYCSKDLNYSKALHGLSSIKQYECKFVLEKIHNIFESRNQYLRGKARLEGKKFRMQQNFLVSVEDFAFIFKEQNNIDNRLKNILLLVEKDLLAKYKFNVIVARPKQLFTIAFVSIDKTIEDDFLAEFGKYLTLDKSATENSRSDRWGNRVKDIGNIYRIDLQKLWEEKFVDTSFPLLKKSLYEGTLFKGYENMVAPRYKLKVSLKKSVEETKNGIIQNFGLIEKIFSSEIFDGRYASERELETEIKRYFPSEMESVRIKEVLIGFYTSSNDWGKSGGGLGLDNFIQEKKDSTGYSKKYRVINSSYQKVKNSFIKHFDEMFTEETFERFLAPGNNDYRLKLANILELFGLGSYEIEGGEFPRIFIRINDPYKIKKIASDGDYSNIIVSDIERKYRRSIKYIDNFFTKMDDSERWNFIEGYFLGNQKIIEE